MTRADVDGVVAVHLNAFPRFFLSGLGAAVLRELYRGILGDAHGIACVAARGGIVLGFAAGTLQPRGFYRRLFIRRWWSMGPAVALRCAREPRVAIQILRRLIDGGTPVSSPDAAALLSLAVSRTAQSGGLGTLLTNAFIDDARSRGGRAIVLTTDADDNESTIAFYERLGFVRTATFESREGRRMHQYEFGIAG